ncbi:hypothetical protein GOA57_05195 [Sinorhizobium meliloti]|nr:hypothetical protein [Sinorhizobium meliloti]
MSVKTNVLVAGGIAAVIGIGKQLTSGMPIPGWLTLLIWVPIVALLGYVAVSIYETNKQLGIQATAKRANELKDEAE